MVIIQKEVVEIGMYGAMWVPKYSLLVSWDPYVDVARDIKKDYPERMLFNNIWEISWGYMKCEWYKITVDDAEEYSRCEVETQREIVTYRRVYVDPEVDYNFISLF